MTNVTPEQFKVMSRAGQQEFLASATMGQALAAGIEAVCSNCAEPVASGDDSHRCDPAHLAEVMQRLRDGTTW
jgi:hypothetical protein